MKLLPLTSSLAISRIRSQRQAGRSKDLVRLPDSLPPHPGIHQTFHPGLLPFIRRPPNLQSPRLRLDCLRLIL